MIEKIKLFFRRIAYMFAFGMKGANDEILSQNVDNADIGIIQNQEEKSLGRALLKGEVTQQVEQLRYRNYRISREAKNYIYLGDGNAIKTTKPTKKDKYSFIQNNSLICETVLHELQRVNQYGDKEKYTFTITYKDIMRIQLAPYITYGKFTIDTLNKNAKIDFYFEKSVQNRYDPISYRIIQELTKISKFTSTYEIQRNDICSNLDSLDFITNKANGEDDLMNYIFMDLQYDGCQEFDDGFILSYQCNNINIIDLTEQFYNKIMDEKYKTKESKNIDYELFGEERRSKCDLCGKEINNYDADVTKETLGLSMCQDCLEKYLENKHNNS